MDARKETRRLVSWLRLAVYLSARSQREIEIRSGFSRGYLSQLLGGRVDLKIWHLLVILEAIDTSPADFFFLLFPRRRQRAREAFLGLCPFARGYDKPLGRGPAQPYIDGLESLQDLDERLARCEDALAGLDRPRISPKKT